MGWRPAVWDKDETRKVKIEARITTRIYKRKKDPKEEMNDVLKYILYTQ